VRGIKPNQHVWAYKRPTKGEVTIHRGDESRYTGVVGWVTVCDRIVPVGNYRWIWCELRTLNPEALHWCPRCWK
jgi:hypothetical protein